MDRTPDPPDPPNPPEPADRHVVMSPLSQGETVPAEQPIRPLWEGPFRLLVAAHGFSGLAFWAFFGTIFAEATYHYHATQSEMAVLGMALSVPFILGSLAQGLVVDRWSPKWIAIIGYVLACIAVSIAWTGHSLGALYASAFTIGLSWAAVEPARSALTGLLVDEDRLVRANGTLAVVFQVSLALGPLVSGWLLATTGADTVYAVAFGLAVMAPLLLLGIPDVRQRGRRPELSFSGVRDGWRFSVTHPDLRILLVVSAAAWGLFNVFFILEPIFVKTVLERGESAVLFLWFAHGAGATAGALVVTSWRRAAGREAVLVCAGVTLAGLGIFIYTGVAVFAVALAAAAVVGIGFAFLYPLLMAYLQRVAPEEMRGRVTSVFISLQEGTGLVTSLGVFVLGARLAVQPTLVAGGALIVVCGLVGLRAQQRLERERRRRDASAA